MGVYYRCASIDYNPCVPWASIGDARPLEIALLFKGLWYVSHCTEYCLVVVVWKLQHGYLYVVSGMYLLPIKPISSSEYTIGYINNSSIIILVL